MDLRFYSTSVTREPLFLLSRINEIPSNPLNLKHFINRLLNDNVFCAGLYLAAPELHREWIKCNSDETNESKNNRIRKSILKYYLRCCSNPIPFGLFATYSQSNPKHKTINTKYFCFVDLDTEYFRKVIKFITDDPSLREIIRYRFNASLFKIGNAFRYIEYQDNPENFRRNYTLGLIETDEVLNLLVQTFTEEHSFLDIKNYLIEYIDNVSEQEVINYLNDLISSKVLISSLDLNLNMSPIEYLENIFKEKIDFRLENPKIADMYRRIAKVHNKLKSVEFDKIEDEGAIYLEEIDKYIQDLLDVKQNRSVMMINLKKENIQQMPNQLEEQKILKALEVYESFTLWNFERKLQSDKNLENFRNQFINRYGENVELPLLEVLDNEVGIGYLIGWKEESSFSSLIDDFETPQIDTKSGLLTVNFEIDIFWTTKIIEAINCHQCSIDLSTSELPKLKDSNNHIAGTFPVSYSKFNNMIFDIRAGAHSALHHIGRFTFIDQDLALFADEIVNDEKIFFDNKLTAEIFHHASNNSGNVTLRKIRRPYEITILTNPTGYSSQIPLTDIYIKINGEKVILTSKKLNKEIVPFLSSAQNFHFDTLPIYHLFCDLQAQYRNNYLTLGISPFLLNNFQFIPRICYGADLVLSPATWRVWKDELTTLKGVRKAVDMNEFEDFRNLRKIPRFVFFMDNKESKFLLDLKSEVHLEVLFDLIKQVDYFVLKECLYDPSNPSGAYVNENIKFLLVKNKNSVAARSHDNHHINFNQTKKKYLPANDWLYYKFYTGIDFSDRFISGILNSIVVEFYSKGLITKWFFIRYADPDYHLRVRFLLSNKSNTEDVIKLISNNITDLVHHRLIWRTEISTYERELDRYGADIHISESIFHLSSELFLKGLIDSKKTSSNKTLWLSAMWETDQILNAFGMDLNEKTNFSHEQFLAFCKEINLGKSEISRASKKFKQNEAIIELHFQLRSQNCKIDCAEDLFFKTIKKLSKNKSADEIRSLAASHIHMHINRYFKAKPRVHELLIYGFLEKKYNKLSALQSKQMMS